MSTMNAQQIKRAKTLTYLGALPFFLPIVGLYVGMNPTRMEYMLISYGAVIVSFLAGSQWGFSVTKTRESRFNVLIMSNSAALSAWACLWLPFFTLQCVLIMACLVALWGIDRKLKQEGTLEAWYLAMRTRITLAVCVALSLMMMLHES